MNRLLDKRLLPLLGPACVHAARPFFPEDIARQAQHRAEQAGLSLSRYLAELVKRDAANSSGWPEGSWMTSSVLSLASVIRLGFRAW